MNHIGNILNVKNLDKKRIEELLQIFHMRNSEFMRGRV